MHSGCFTRRVPAPRICTVGGGSVPNMAPWLTHGDRALAHHKSQLNHSAPAGGMQSPTWDTGIPAEAGRCRGAKHPEASDRTGRGWTVVRGCLGQVESMAPFQGTLYAHAHISVEERLAGKEHDNASPTSLRAGTLKGGLAPPGNSLEMRILGPAPRNSGQPCAAGPAPQGIWVCDNTGGSFFS